MGNPESSILCPKCFTFNEEVSDFCNKCGAPLEEKEGTLSILSKGVSPEDIIYLSPGDYFGKRYRIIEEIGRGGMGRVYKADDQELNITVALKIISPKYSANQRFIERFKKEVLSARSISHENVIRIFDLGEEKGIKYFSMEYIKGQNLKDLMRTTGSLTINRAIEITRQICYALRAAHNRGIIHRDLKPANIMIDNNGQAYVMDFGLARSISGLEPEKPKAIEGTPKYMSPEQIHKDKLDHRTDIYALGLILYEMLTGQPAFDADSESEYYDRQVKDIPRIPSEINPNIPLSLNKLIVKCLEKDKEKRYPSVQEILRQLSREDFATELPAPLPKKRRLPLALSVVLVTVIFAAAFLIWKGQRDGPQKTSFDNRKSLAILYFENNTGDESLDYMCREFTNLMIFDLLQSTYIRPLTPDRIVDLHKELDLTGNKQYSTADLQRIAERGSVDHVLCGSLHKPEDAFSVNLLLYSVDPWGNIGSASSQGILVSTIVDDLSHKIKRTLNLTDTMIAGDIDRKIGEIITASPEASELYFEGARLYEGRKYRESNDALFTAVDIDPEFALAYRKISLNFDYMGDDANSKKYLEEAMKHLDRVSDRERYLILGYYGQHFSASIAQPLQSYEELLKIYPDDIDGNVQLGSVYRNIEEWDKSLERFEKVLSIEDANVFGIQNRVYILKAKGLYEEAREFLEAHSHGYASKAVFHRTMSHLYLDQGRLEDAARELEEILQIDPESVIYHRLKGHIHVIRNEWDAADTEYGHIIQKGSISQQLGAWVWKSRLLLARGQLKKAREEIDAGIEFSLKNKLKAFEQDFLLLRAYVNLRLGDFPEAVLSADQAYENATRLFIFDRMRLALLFKGLAQLEAGEIELAEQTAIELKSQIEISGCDRFVRVYQLLMGCIALKKGNPAVALVEVGKAVEALSHQKSQYDNHSLYFYTLAEAAERAGVIDKAQTYHERMIALTSGRLGWGDRYALSYYRLGKIYQDKGWRDRAIEKYRQFVQIWKDSDIGQMEKEDAAQQLASLEPGF
jgi:serine/threonine protein kinase/tetratricopeptide (TPR) repeat protein